MSDNYVVIMQLTLVKVLHCFTELLLTLTHFLDEHFLPVFKSFSKEHKKKTVLDPVKYCALASQSC